MSMRMGMQDGYRHEALPYSGHAEFVSACTALARDGLDREERLILLAAGAKLTDIQDALGADSAEVSFVPTDEHGRNPSRITTLLDTFQSSDHRRRCLGVTEWDYARRPRRALAEVQFAESVLNTPPLQAWPMTLFCAYDCLDVDQDMVGSMRRSHPAVRGEEHNAEYEPDLAASLFAMPLDDPPAEMDSMRVRAGELGTMRAEVREHGRRCQLPDDRGEDLVLAVNEVATNSVRYGGGTCRLCLWDAEDAAVCQVSDAGVITDPLVGRLAPPTDASAGRGLWLANHLCDLVQIRSSQAGTVVRLYVDRAP